jgi:hypothetical protein
VFGVAGAGYLFALGFGDGVTLDLTDLSGSGNAPFNFNVTAGSGTVGGGGNFNGTDSFLYYNPRLASPDTTFTVSFWARSVDVSAASGAMGYPNGQFGGYTDSVGIFENSQPKWSFWFYDKLVPGVVTLNDPTVIVNNTWYHVVAVYNVLSRQAIYVNGALGNQRNAPVNGNNWEAHSHVGRCYTYAGSRSWNGLMDEVRASPFDLPDAWPYLEYNAVQNQSSVVLWGSEVNASNIPAAMHYYRRRRAA